MYLYLDFDSLWGRLKKGGCYGCVLHLAEFNYFHIGFGESSLEVCGLLHYVGYGCDGFNYNYEYKSDEVCYSNGVYNVAYRRARGKMGTCRISGGVDIVHLDCFPFVEDMCFLSDTVRGWVIPVSMYGFFMGSTWWYRLGGGTNVRPFFDLSCLDSLAGDFGAIYDRLFRSCNLRLVGRGFTQWLLVVYCSKLYEGCFGYSDRVLREVLELNRGYLAEVFGELSLDVKFKDWLILNYMGGLLTNM